MTGAYTLSELAKRVDGSVRGSGEVVIRGVNTVSARTLRNILSGWFLTPVLSCIFALGIYFFSQLQFVPPAG